MSAKKIKVILTHSMDDYIGNAFIDVKYVWVNKDGLVKLKEIWLSAKLLLQEYPSVSVLAEASSYIDFPKKCTEEEEMADVITVEMDATNRCTLTISDGSSEAFGDFNL